MFSDPHNIVITLRNMPRAFIIGDLKKQHSVSTVCNAKHGDISGSINNSASSAGNVRHAETTVEYRSCSPEEGKLAEDASLHPGNLSW